MGVVYFSIIPTFEPSRYCKCWIVCFYYTKIFPINTGPLSVDTVNQVRTFAKKIEGITETNMLTFVEYCFQQMPGEKLWEERGEK